MWAHWNLIVRHTVTRMNKFLLSFQNHLLLLTATLNQNHWWPTSGKFYRHEDWLESHHWPNGGKLLIIQPKATGGPRVAQRWQNLPTVRRWATGRMLSGMYLPILVKIHNTFHNKKINSNTQNQKNTSSTVQTQNNSQNF